MVWRCPDQPQSTIRAPVYQTGTSLPRYYAMLGILVSLSLRVDIVFVCITNNCFQTAIIHILRSLVSIQTMRVPISTIELQTCPGRLQPANLWFHGKTSKRVIEIHVPRRFLSACMVHRLRYTTIVYYLTNHIT